MLLECMTGYETFSRDRGMNSGSYRLVMFYKQNVNEEDQPINIAAKDKNSGCTLIGREDYVQASLQNRNHGLWVTARYNLASHSFCKLLITRKADTDFIMKHAQFVFHNRPEAALRRLRIPLTGNHQAAISAAYVQGKFDIVKAKDLNSLGFTINPKFIAQYEVNDYDEWFTETILETERSPLIMPTTGYVKTEKGRTIKVTKTIRPRNIKL